MYQYRSRITTEETSNVRQSWWETHDIFQWWRMFQITCAKETYQAHILFVRVDWSWKSTENINCHQYSIMVLVEGPHRIEEYHPKVVSHENLLEKFVASRPFRHVSDFFPTIPDSRTCHRSPCHRPDSNCKPIYIGDPLVHPPTRPFKLTYMSWRIFKCQRHTRT